MRALVVVAASLLCAADAGAADVVKLVLGPFGASGTDGPALREAVELELIVREDLLLSEPDGLYADVGRDLADVPAEQIGRALTALDQHALLRGEPRGRGVVVVLLHRAGDGGVVYARRVDAKQALTDLRLHLLDDLGPALGDVDELQPLLPSELARVEIEEDVLTGGDAGPPKGILHDPNARVFIEEPPPDPPPKPPPEAPREPSRPALKEREERPRLKDVEPAEDAPALVRASVALAPVWYAYRACPVLDTKTPFNCRARASAPPTEVSPGFVPELGGAFAFEIAPASFIAITADGALFFTAVRASFPPGSGLGLVVERNAVDVFNVLGGTAAVGAVLRYRTTMGAARVSAGAQVGYRGLFLLAQDNHLLIQGVEEPDFTLLPSYSTHAVGVGPRLAATLADRATVGLEVDGLLGAHLEGPTRVGDADALGALGVHAKATLDVDVAFGLYVAAHASLDAMNAGAEGTGTRLTRALQPFSNAPVDYWQASVGIGVGYRY